MHLVPENFDNTDYHVVIKWTGPDERPMTFHYKGRPSMRKWIAPGDTVQVPVTPEDFQKFKDGHYSVLVREALERGTFEIISLIEPTPIMEDRAETYYPTLSQEIASILNDS